MQPASPATSLMIHDRHESDWPLAKLVAFRFLAVYFVLYAFPFPLDMLPWLNGYFGSMTQQGGWTAVIPWIAEHVFRIDEPINTQLGGSGDTLYHYLCILSFAMCAVIVTLIWSLLSRRRSYRTAAQWLTLACCFYLGSWLVSYGFAKLVQFPAPSLTRLIQPYGESSPMGLLWTFMGTSTTYTIFTGVGEVLGGLLLFFRRTRTLGAAIAFGVMLHVVMLNLSYDVPVKLFSSHLLAMAAVLLWSDRQRLAALFVWNRPTHPRPIAPWFASRAAHLATQTVLLLFIGWVAFFNVVSTLASYSLLTIVPEQQPLYGIYEVTSFVQDGEERPPLLTDTVRWRGVIFEQTLPMQFGELELPGTAAVWQMDGRLAYHVIELDADARTVNFPPAPSTAAQDQGLPQPGAIDSLTYEQPSPDELVLRGHWQGHDVEIRLVRRSLEEMELLGRGFHWINETPHNV
jgi:uncharacterized membrane protein YphA (DoxX/SURF4 family)